MVIGVGQRCVVRVKIADVELRNARNIVATVESPQYVAHCQEVSFDEVSGLVYVVVDVKSAGSYSMWLEVRFAKEVVYTPAFVFAEVEGEAAPCDAPYIVDVEVAGESITVTPPKVDVDGEGGASITVDTVLSETSNNAIANSAVAKALKTKQDTLTLTTKPNGNIVIGNLAGQSKEFMPATPSGDPMHYAYEAVGAVWNASTGYWSYRAEEGGLSDLTNADMRLAYAEAYLSTVIAEGVRFEGTARLLINKTEWVTARAIGNSYCKNDNLEVAEIARKYKNCIFTTAYNCFNYNPKLHTILGILDYNYSSGVGSAPPYKQCYALQNITVRNLKHNIAFSDSSHLSKESLLYMINNCVSGVSFTITLHPDVYAKCIREEDYEGEWWQDIDDAMTDAELTKQTRITLASA